MVADEAEAPMGVDSISISVDTSIVATVLDLGMVRAGRAVDGGVDRRLATSSCGGTWLVSDRVIYVLVLNCFPSQRQDTDRSYFHDILSDQLVDSRLHLKINPDLVTTAASLSSS